MERIETQFTTEGSASFTRAVTCMLKRLRKHHSEASVHIWSFFISRNAVRGQSGDRGMLGRGTGGTETTGAWIYFGGYLLETSSSTQQIVALSTTESEYISTKDVCSCSGDPQ